MGVPDCHAGGLCMRSELWTHYHGAGKACAGGAVGECLPADIFLYPIQGGAGTF